MRETPRPPSGPTKFSTSLPPSHSEFISSQGIRPVEVEPISEPLVKQDDVLCVFARLPGPPADDILPAVPIGACAPRSRMQFAHSYDPYWDVAPRNIETRTFSIRRCVQTHLQDRVEYQSPLSYPFSLADAEQEVVFGRAIHHLRD